MNGPFRACSGIGGTFSVFGPETDVAKDVAEALPSD